MTLKKLYEELNTPRLIHLTNQPVIIEEQTKLSIKNALEQIILQGPKQQFSLNTFTDNPTLARYSGLSSQEMIQTINELKLPRNHNNYAHFTFKFFKQHLQNHTGAAVINKAVPKGQESHFLDLLRRLDATYSNQEVYATR